MADNVTKTYTPLSQIEGAQARGCSALMPNRMQCWRAGDVQVVVAKTEPATKDKPLTVTETLYQLCYRHAHIEQHQDVIAAENAEREAEKVVVKPAVPITPAAPAVKKTV